MLVFLGFALVPLIDLLTRWTNDSSVRKLIALTVSGIFGALFAALETALFEGLNFTQIITAIGVHALATAQVAEVGYTGLSLRIPGLDTLNIPGWENSDVREGSVFEPEAEKKKK